MILLAVLTTIYVIGYVATIKVVGNRANTAKDLGSIRSNTPVFYYISLGTLAVLWPVFIVVGLVIAASK